MGEIIELRDIGIEDIFLIREQWELNRIFHERSSEFFSELYKGIDFNSRMQAFEKIGKDDLKITIAVDGEAVVGYCLSTAVDGEGEICTLHVDESIRGSGVGRQLCEQHMHWMKKKVCTFISVTVSQENQPTQEFYRKLGFYPNTMQMVLK